MKHKKEGTVHSVPSPPTSSPKTPLRFWGLRILFLTAALSLGVWGLLNHPAYRDYRLSRLTLEQLQKERGQRMDDSLILYYIGLRLNEKEQFSLADPFLRQAVGLNPSNPRYRDEWARALLGSGLTTAAFGQLKEFVGSHNNLAEAHLLMGKFYVTQRSMIRASEELERAIELDKNNGEAWALYYQAQEGLGNIGKAREAAVNALRLRPNNATDHLVMATFYTRENEQDKARKEFEAAVKLAPRMGLVHRDYARWLHIYGKPEDEKQKEAVARKAVELTPKDPISQITLGRILVQSKRYEEAIVTFLRAEELSLNDLTVANELTQCYKALGNVAETTNWRNIASQRQKYAMERNQLWEKIRVNPENMDLRRKLARLYGINGDVQGSIHQYSTVLRSALDSPAVMIATTKDLCEGGYAKLALPLAERAVSISSASPAAHEALGDAYLGTNQEHLAGLQYNKVASWEPEKLPLLKKKLEKHRAERLAKPSKAEIAYRTAIKKANQQVGPRQMTEEVEEFAQKAVGLEPSNPHYLWFLLQVQVARKQNDNAIKTGAQLIQLAPKDHKVLAVMATLLVEKANTPEELRVVENYLRFAEKDPAVATTLHYGKGLLALRRKQATVAIQEFKKTIELDPNTDVTYYQLALAQKLANDENGAAKSMAEFNRLRDRKRQQAEALGDVAQNPKNPELYEKAARLFDSHGLKEQAKAIRQAARQRFGRGVATSTQKQ